MNNLKRCTMPKHLFTKATLSNLTTKEANHFPIWQVAYPSLKSTELIVGYFEDESPPMLSGQKTPGYIPVDTGYFPVSNAALIWVYG